MCVCVCVCVCVYGCVMRIYIYQFLFCPLPRRHFIFGIIRHKHILSPALLEPDWLWLVSIHRVWLSVVGCCRLQWIGLIFLPLLLRMLYIYIQPI